jgi:hypothetical protein
MYIQVIKNNLFGLKLGHDLAYGRHSYKLFPVSYTYKTFAQLKEKCCSFHFAAYFVLFESNLYWFMELTESYVIIYS